MRLTLEPSLPGAPGGPYKTKGSHLTEGKSREQEHDFLNNSKWIAEKILTTGPLRPCLMWDRSGGGPMGPMEPRGPGCPGGPGIPGKPGLPFGPGEPAIKEQLVSSASCEEGQGAGSQVCEPLQPFLCALCPVPSDTSSGMSHWHFKFNPV